MAAPWVTPQYNKGEVNAAGEVLASNERDPAKKDAALEVVDNWRSSHSFPLNTFQVGLRKRAREVYPHALVAQRLKRVPSMLLKLQRFPTMDLSQMQDIGGCRAVVDSVGQVHRLRDAYLESSLKHKLVTHKDYIEDPKDSGYRSIHLVYRYASDKKTTYNGLQIEMQLRSRLQHAWATAVETVGTFLDQALKASEGSEQWLRFFAVTSSAFALLEKTPTVPNTPDDRAELRAQVTAMAAELQVDLTLSAYGETLKITEEEATPGSHYYLMSLTPGETMTLDVASYAKQELERATNDYLAKEKALSGLPGAQAVLVAAESMGALRRAYPNYYLDTNVFLEYLTKVRKASD